MGQVDGTQWKNWRREHLFLGRHCGPGVGHVSQRKGSCMSLSGRRPLPNRIERLSELASDLWWSWNPVAREAFRRLDYPLWRQTRHNPGCWKSKSFRLSTSATREACLCAGWLL
ncbi:MAG: hypothetical protein DMG13_22745 [Acidobacteria bacterium]|nr:MAG: hypothetical protein DMG13_22745 [Acidobacteriota bacterium]